MEKNFYDPHAEARKLGLLVRFIRFKKLNSFLTRSVVYLRESMNEIEKRCCLAYEIVHYMRGHLDKDECCIVHSGEEEEIIRQETAKKLVCEERFHKLIGDCKPVEEITKELKITEEVLIWYFKANLTKTSATAQTNRLSYATCPISSEVSGYYTESGLNF